MLQKIDWIKKCIIHAGLIIIVIFFLAGILAAGNEKKGDVKSITPEDAQELIKKNKNNPDFIILDVRTPQEFNEGHLEEALNIDYSSPDFKKELEKLDRKKLYLVYCRSGVRSTRAVGVMKDTGFKLLYNMSGGIIAWESKGYPVIRK